MPVAHIDVTFTPSATTLQHTLEVSPTLFST